MSDQNHPYGSPSAPAESRGKGMAIGALIIGIIALLFSWTVLVGIVAGLVALVLGIVAARRAKQGRAGGRGMAITGAVLGFLGLLIGVAFVVGVLAFLQSDSAQNLQDCLSNAGNDQAAIDQCRLDFEDQVTN